MIDVNVLHTSLTEASEVNTYVVNKLNVDVHRTLQALNNEIKRKICRKVNPSTLVE